MGHALWVISDGTHRLGYASHLALAPEPMQPGADGSCSVESYALEFEPGTLRGLSALVLGPGAVAGGQRPVAVAPGATGYREPPPGEPPSVVDPRTRDPQGKLPDAPEDPIPVLDIPGACSQIAGTLRSGGSVLVAVPASGTSRRISEGHDWYEQGNVAGGGPPSTAWSGAGWDEALWLIDELYRFHW